MSGGSNESFIAMKRNILQEIKKLDNKINYITTLKEEAIENLTKQKKQQEFEQEILGEDNVIDEEIASIEKKHIEVVRRQSAIHEVQSAYEKLTESLTEINKELTTIQERHEDIMNQLHEKRQFLQERLNSIETMDTMQLEIENEMQFELNAYTDELDRITKLREALLKRTDLSPSEMELELTALDAQLETLEAHHILQMNKLGKKFSSIQQEMSESFTLSRKDKILKELEMLRLQTENATPEELVEIENRMEELRKELDQLQMLADINEEAIKEQLSEALEQRGLHLTPSGNVVSSSGRIMTMDEAKELGLLDGVEEELANQRDREAFAQLMEERGLTLTPSGRIRTEAGEVLTFDEARKLGLLRGIEAQLMKLRGLTLTASGRIMNKDGKVFSREEAERLGLLAGIKLDDIYEVESESVSVSSSSTVTSLSAMSTADVHYLKSVLGRPLALALAEITAKQPRDPIHYLGHWLYKYRYNQEIDEVRKKELTELLEERERLARIALRQQAETEAKEVLIDLLGRVDHEVERIAIETELRRIELDTAAMEAEEAELESEARDTLGVYTGPTKGQQLI